MAEIEICPGGSKEPEGQYCIDWCSAKHLSQMIVVGCGKDNNASIYYLDKNNKWLLLEVLNGHTDLVRDVAWAPHIGRSFQLIATACKDGHVRVFKLTPKSMNKTKPVFTIEQVADFDDHQGEVWRVEWNVTGTILSSSGDDGKLRLWKGIVFNVASYLDEWKLISVISAEQPGTELIR